MQCKETNFNSSCPKPFFFLIHLILSCADFSIPPFQLAFIIDHPLFPPINLLLWWATPSGMGGSYDHLLASPDDGLILNLLGKKEYAPTGLGCGCLKAA